MSRTPPIPLGRRPPPGPDGEWRRVAQRVTHRAERARNLSDHAPKHWTATTILTLGSLIGFALGLIVTRSGETSD